MKLYLLSGFLGAGKTTFLNHVLDQNPDKKVGIIMNEFGKIGIDGPILERDGLEMVELNRGSIFCSCLQLSFVQAMVEMSKMNLDYLIVESSGLADPSNISEVLDCVKAEVGDVYQYSGSICLVDGLHFLEQDDELETIKRQIQCSHIAFINKVEDAPAEQVQIISDRINTYNPSIYLEKGSYGKLERPFLGEDLTDEKTFYTPSLNTKENKPKTLHLTFDGQVDQEKLNRFIEQVSAHAYRIKGFVATSQGQQEVHGVLSQVEWKATDKELDQSTLVFISKIGPGIIKHISDAWKAEIGQPMKLGNG